MKVMRSCGVVGKIEQCTLVGMLVLIKALFLKSKRVSGFCSLLFDKIPSDLTNFIVQGPLIRILGDRFSPKVRAAVLETLTLLLEKVRSRVSPQVSRAAPLPIAIPRFRPAPTSNRSCPSCRPRSARRCTTSTDRSGWRRRVA